LNAEPLSDLVITNLEHAGDGWLGASPMDPGAFGTSGGDPLDRLPRTGSGHAGSGAGGLRHPRQTM
jgi:hypothetical protein